MTPATTRLDDTHWLTTGALASVLAALDGNGEETRVVGGAVRNALLREPVADVDLATTALPAEVVRRAEQAGFRAVPTGIEHGTVTVVADGTPFEVTSLREDVETFGRKAKVAFGRDWKTDAERRDFTINALSASPDGTVYDYVGGLADLPLRRVRFIGDPARRIEEDYLRILRFFRFQAAYGHGVPDAAGVHACIVARNGLRMLSRERVRMEVIKLVVAPHAVPTLVVMAEAGLMELVIMGVPHLASFANMAKVESVLGLAPDPMRRLGALAVVIVEDAERLSAKLRLSTAEQDRLRSLAEAWWRISPAMEEAAARALIYRIGPDRFVDRVALAWTRSPAGAADKAWHGLATLPRRWQTPGFPIKAADFLRRGIAKGPGLGVALRAAEEAWIAAGFPSEPDAIGRIIAQTVGSDDSPPARPGESRDPD